MSTDLQRIRIKDIWLVSLINRSNPGIQSGITKHNPGIANPSQEISLLYLITIISVYNHFSLFVYSSIIQCIRIFLSLSVNYT